jgi:hypothetical protein
MFVSYGGWLGLSERSGIKRFVSFLVGGSGGRSEIFMCCLMLFLLVFFVTYKIFGSGLPGGTDMFAHLFWVQSFWKSFQSFTYPTWSPFWYGGYPIMLTYAPFSHILSALVSLPLQDYVLGTKIVIFLSFLVSAWATYFVCREFGLKSCAGVVAGVAYAFGYHRFLQVSVRGSLSSAVAIGFLPLFFLFVVRLFKSLDSKDSSLVFRNVVFSSLTLAAVFLGHLTVGLCAIILLAVYTLYYVLYNLFIRHWSDMWEEEIARKRSASSKCILAFLAVFGLFLLFAAFWLIPALSYLNITGMSANLESIEATSSTSTWAANILSFFIDILTRQFGWYAWYIGISVFFFAVLGAIYKIKQFPINFLSIFFLVSIFLLVWGPPIFEGLPIPFLGTLSSFRLFVLLVFSVSLLTGVFAQAILEYSRKFFKQSNIKQMVAYLSLFLLFVSVIIVDFSPGFGRLATTETSSVLQKEFDWLSEKTGEFRVYSYGVYAIQGSMERYGPAVHGKELLHGNDEGSITRETLRSLEELDWMVEEAPSSEAVSERFVDGLTRKFRFSCVKYFVVGPEILGVVDILDSSNVFICHKLDDSLYICEFSEPIKDVQPVSRVLVVGDADGTELVNDLVFWCPLDFVYDIMDPSEVNSINARLLSNYDLVIVYGLDTSNLRLAGVFEEYLNQGGNILVDTSTLAGNYSFLGVQCIATSVQGDIVVTVNPKYTELNMAPHDDFSPADYEGNPWDFHTYSGLDDTIANVNNYTLLGYRNVGEGRAYFLGFNLIYHIEDYGNEQERKFMNSILDFILEEETVEISSVNSEAESLTFTADVSSPSVTLLVSRSYFPNWKAYDNGKEIEISQSRDGWLLINLKNGIHQIELKYEVTIPYTLGFLISLFTLALTATVLIVSKRKPTVFRYLKKRLKLK